MGSCQRMLKKKRCLLSEVVQSPKNTVLFCVPQHTPLPRCLSVTGWEKTPKHGLCSNVEVTSMNVLLRTQATWIKSFPQQEKEEASSPFLVCLSWCNLLNNTSTLSEMAFFPTVTPATANTDICLLSSWTLKVRSSQSASTRNPCKLVSGGLLCIMYRPLLESQLRWTWERARLAWFSSIYHDMHGWCYTQSYQTISMHLSIAHAEGWTKRLVNWLVMHQNFSKRKYLADV